MKYDPIMCMMVPDSVKTKDESYVVRGKKYKVVKRDGDNVTVIGPDGKVTKMHIDLLMSEGTKTKDGLDDPEKNAGYEMKKEGQYFKIYKNGKLIGMKSTEEEARREASRHRAANDSNTLDKAITTCDKTEFDPQDTRYIRKAIGNLKIANSLLGMINDGTVNKAKQNIANSISLLESID